MTPLNTAEAYAPASMGNVGVGFDILGLAYEQPGDRVIARRDPSVRGVTIEAITGDAGRLPTDPAANVASVAAAALLAQVGRADLGVSLTLHKGLPLASGMGSSAASAVAAVVAVNALLDDPLPREALLNACLEGEALVSGRHADNVAPALLGGILLIDSAMGLHPLPVPESLVFGLATPQVAVPTAKARAALPTQVSLKTMIAQTVSVAALVDALHRGDIAAAARAMAADYVVEPARQHLIPHLAQARAAAESAGALGVVISGAGPTLAAVCDSVQAAARSAAAMQRVYVDAGIGATALHSGVSRGGAVILNRA